jgi:hypothetical protein
VQTVTGSHYSVNVLQNPPVVFAEPYKNRVKCCWLFVKAACGPISLVILSLVSWKGRRIFVLKPREICLVWAADSWFRAVLGEVNDTLYI